MLNKITGFFFAPKYTRNLNVKDNLLCIVPSLTDADRVRFLKILRSDFKVD